MAWRPPGTGLSVKVTETAGAVEIRDRFDASRMGTCKNTCLHVPSRQEPVKPEESDDDLPDMWMGHGSVLLKEVP